jgi:predicted DNA binding CopG/RHH family protein
MKLLKEHQKADKRIKILLEDRLVDANFHSEAGLLANGDYEGYIELVRKTYKFREKFEVMTETECQRIKDPKQFEDGLAKVISDYLASQGIKDTSVNVRFIENW